MISFQSSTTRRPRRFTRLAAWGFALPLCIYLILFYVAPLLQNISMSLHRYTRRTFVTGGAPFAGLDIYKEVLSSNEFWTTLLHTLIFVVASIAVQYTLGLALAVFFFQPIVPSILLLKRHFPGPLASAPNGFRNGLAVDDGC